MMLFIFYFLFTLDAPNNWTGSSVCDVVGNESLRLEDAQTVQLEDGTTAYIHHTAKGFSFPLFLICSKMLNGIRMNMLFNISISILHWQIHMNPIPCRRCSWRTGLPLTFIMLFRCRNQTPFWPSRRMAQ